MKLFRFALLGLLLCAIALVGPARAQLPLTFQITGPAGATPIEVSTTGGTGQVTATLTGASNQWTYICGFVVTSGGTSSSNIQTVTVTGLANTMSFAYVFPSTGQGILGVALGPGCIVSSAKNTSIVVTVPGGGAGTTVAVTAWGYTL